MVCDDKKTPIQDYMNVRKTGLAAISLREDDLLIEVKVTDNAQDILPVSYTHLDVYKRQGISCE